MLNETGKCYVAISLPPNVAAGVHSALASSSDEPGDNLDLVAAANYHITLGFLGNVAIPEIKALSERLSHTAAQSTPFRIGITGGGTFPEASVVYAAVADPTGALHRLWDAVGVDCLGVGDATDRYTGPGFEYQPHVTVAKTDVQPGSEHRARILRNLAGVDVTYRVAAMTLFVRGPELANLHFPFGSS